MVKSCPNAASGHQNRPGKNLRRITAAAAILALPLLVVLSAAMPATGQEKSACLDCHFEGNGKGAPEMLSMEGSAHEELSCEECHPGDMPPCPPETKPVSCSTCHKDELRKIGGSDHGKALQTYLKEKVEDLQLVDLCMSCHGKDIHHVKAHDQEGSAVHRLNVVDTCLTCHSETGDYMVEEYRDSIHSPEEALGPDKTAAAVCTDCHGGGHDINGPAKEDSVLSHENTHETCGACHDMQKDEFLQSIHSEELLKGDPDVPTCTNCHGTHDIYGKNDVRSRINALKVDETCIECHADPEVAERHPDLPDPEFILQYEDTVHGRGIHTKGLLVSASCASCHGEHAIRPKDDPDSTVNWRHVPETCGECHAGIYERWEESEHGQMWKRDDPEGPVCTTCHSSHEIQEPTRQLFTTFQITKQCQGCHEEHSESYHRTFHGKTVTMGFLVAAKCSDCHTPHHNLGPDDPESTINPENLTETCGQCHEGVNENFVQYDAHPNPHDKEDSALLYYAKLFMDGLIIAVFGFFGIHTLLWLQRSIVAYIRGELEPTFPLEGVKHVRRWSTSAVVMHIVIVTSFLGLIATGLPLRYYYTEWAGWLGSIYGGVEVSRLIHRIFAAVTIGYALYHMAFLFNRLVMKKERGLLYGPDTMVPHVKDLVDIKDNFKYFFYLGPPPRFGKWTYYEKFDYFALFWGVPIVVISGLVMLFPSFFSNFLPGDILNLASLVHSEEALLAAGFIFVFHFFHNHLRPGVMPMDINIFTGTMPLERLVEERPAEYERLKKEGMLEAVTIDAPERRVMYESKLFGLIALSIGLFLIVAIFVSFMFG